MRSDFLSKLPWNGELKKHTTQALAGGSSLVSSDRPQILVEPVEALADFILGIQGGVPFFEENVLLDLVRRSQEAKQRKLRRLRRKAGVVPAVQHQHGDGHSRGEVELVRLRELIPVSEASRVHYRDLEPHRAPRGLGASSALLEARREDGGRRVSTEIHESGKAWRLPADRPRGSPRRGRRHPYHRPPGPWRTRQGRLSHLHPPAQECPAPSRSPRAVRGLEGVGPARARVTLTSLADPLQRLNPLPP